MTDNDKALVERLRSSIVGKLPNYIDDAADRIEDLQAQIKTVLDREAETHRRHDAKIEAQAAEIERLQSMVLEGAAKNAAEIVRLELEVERLRGLLDAWLNLAEEHLDTELAGRTFAALEDAKRGRPAKTAPAEE
jgi:hypothetical protein